MNVPAMPLEEVTRRAIHILSRELGVADTMRFLKQFVTGAGDYTAEREKLFANLSLDEILAEVKKTRLPGLRNNTRAGLFTRHDRPHAQGTRRTGDETHPALLVPLCEFPCRYGRAVSEMRSVRLAPGMMLLFPWLVA